VQDLKVIAGPIQRIVRQIYVFQNLSQFAADFRSNGRGFLLQFYILLNTTRLEWDKMGGEESNGFLKCF